MTATRSQGKPASSSFTASSPASTRSDFLAALSEVFQSVRDRVVPQPVPYRDRLGPQEQALYDEFQTRQKDATASPILLVIANPCGETQFECLETAEEANARALEILQKKNGQYAFTAFDLTQSFESQWIEKPDGSDLWSKAYRANPRAVASGVFLPHPHPEAHLSRKPC